MTFAWAVFAADYQWKTDGRQNDWDWTDSRNFVLKGTETEGAPQANDTVFVPDGLTVKARSSDATSFARVLELGRIEPMGPMQRLQALYSETTVNVWNRTAVDRTLDLIGDLAASVEVVRQHCTMRDEACRTLHRYLTEE